MAFLRASLKDFRATMQQLGKRADAAVNAGLLSTALRAHVILVSESQRKRVMNTGAYQLAWKTERLIKERAVRVFNVAPYAPVVEYGRRPGARQPPTEPIARWVQRKMGLPYAQARGIGYIIARSIGRKGIPAKHVLRDAIPAMRRAMDEEMSRELRRALGGGAP